MTLFDSCHFLFIPLHKWGKWEYVNHTDFMRAKEDGAREAISIITNIHMKSHGDKLKAWNLIRDDILKGLANGND